MTAQGARSNFGVALSYGSHRHPRNNHRRHRHTLAAIQGQGHADRERRLPLRSRAAVREARGTAEAVRRPGFTVLGFPSNQFLQELGNDGRDQGVLLDHLGRHLPDVRPGQGQRQERRTRSTRSSPRRRMPTARPARSPGTSRSSLSRRTARCTVSARRPSRTRPRSSPHRVVAPGQVGAPAWPRRSSISRMRTVTS